MAGERSENLEELVRRIVHSVNRNETSQSNDNGSTSNSVQNRASTVEEELNQRFLIPRGAHSNDSTRAQDVAAQFNPNNNYGYTNNRSRQPSRHRNIPYGFSRQRTSTSRPSYSRRGTRARAAEVSTMKEVILLPHPTTRKVPKFHHKLRLQQCGLISDGCAIERAWNESEVRRFLSSLFFETLKDKHGEPVSFEFVKVIGSEVTPVNISTGQEMNAKVLLGIAKQGPVYIRAMRSLPVFSDEDCSDSDTDNIPTLLHYAPVENSSSVSEENQQSQQQMDRREVNTTNNTVCSGILTPQSSDSGPVLVVEPQTAQASDSALIPVLKDMFPTKSDADINEVITSVQGNLDAAIESLLDQNNIVLDEHGASNFNEELLSLRSVHSTGIALQQYQNQMIDGGLRHYININRNSQTLFRDIVGIYKRARDDLRKKPDVTFEGEEGVDAGGPTLEFLWLALSQMRQGDGGKVSLFEGSSGHLLPVHCTSYLDSGLFYVFGKVVAHSILHGGTGFPGLSPAMGRFIASGDVDSASSLVSAEDIPDTDYKDVIEKILGAKTADDIQQLSSNPLVQVMLDNAGFTGVFLSLENKEIAANQIMVHEVLNKRRREVEDIRRGLESLALVSLLSTCSSLCNQIFPPSQEFGINPEMVKSQITLMEGEVLNNENKRNAFLWLQSYIEQLGVRTKKTGTYHGSQGLEQGPMVISKSANHKTAVSSNESKAHQAAQSTSDDAPGLAEFCQFVSGTPVPPQQPIRVRFSTDDNQTLPVAETCFMWLVLPVTSSCFQEFKKNMDIALKFEATGFYIM